LFSKNKSKQTTNETQTTSGTSTTTPNVPTFLQQPWEQYAGGVSNLMNSGQPLVSGASPLQQQAYSAAMGLTPQTTPALKSYDQPMVNGGPGDGYTAPAASTASSGQPNNFNLATMLGLGAGLGGANVTGPAASASASVFSREALNERMNPYTEQVVDTSLADYDVGAGRATSRAALEASKSGGLFNSNNAIRDAILSGELTRGRASTSAGIRDQGFRTAADILGRDNDRSTQASIANAQAENQMRMFNASQQDNALNRALSAAGLISNIGSAQGADTRANIGLQADLGAQQRDIANQTSPVSQQALIAQLLGYVPDYFVGQTESRNATGNSSGTSTGSGSGFGFNLSDFWGSNNRGRQ